MGITVAQRAITADQGQVLVKGEKTNEVENLRA
jgi:hypothetical protein